VNRLVQVADIVDGVFARMPEVLAPLSPDAHALHWNVLDLGDVVADERWDLNMPFIEAAVRSSPTGMPLSFEELEGLAARTHQVIDGLFVGCEWSNRAPRRSDSDARILELADMLVAERVETVDIEGAPLLAWPRTG
jgi:hypothetical protein